MKALTAALLCMAAGPLFAQGAQPLLTPRELMAIPVEQPDHVLKYGNDPSQFGELRVPDGPGPFPVVVLVHGGCWSSYAGAKSIGAMGDALKRRGIASWNIEFRRLPDAGSGWPGTYLDTGRAIDFLRYMGAPYRLDLTRVVFVGHSAGAHLAHWAAARARLKPASALYVRDPLVPAGVVNLAGRMDMAAGIEAYESLCGGPVVRQLLGGMPAQVPAHYRETSPQALLPLGIPQVLVWGSEENYVPAPQAERFQAAARKAGDDVRLLVVPGAGHFETASPLSAAWPTVLGAIETLLGK